MKIISLFIIGIFVILSFTQGRNNLYIPDSLEYIYGTSSYLKYNDYRFESLNELFDTIHFFSIHNGIRDFNLVLNPKFPGGIFLMAYFTSITGNPIWTHILLCIFMLGIISAATLIVDNSGKIKTFLLLLISSFPLAVFYGGTLFDLQIGYFFASVGIYFLAYKYERKAKVLGHFLICFSCLIRSEFIVLYGIIFLFFGIRNKWYPYILGASLSATGIALLFRVYQGQFGILRDTYGYILRQHYNLEVTERIIEDYDKSFIKTFFQYLRIDGPGITNRLLHIYYLFFPIASLITLFPFGLCYSFLKREKVVILLFFFGFIIYAGTSQYYGFFQDVYGSSFLRYNLLLLILGSYKGFTLLSTYGGKIITILTIFLLMFQTSNSLIKTSNSYGYYHSYTEEIIRIEDQSNCEKEKIIWLAKGDTKKAIFTINHKIFDYNAVPKEFFNQTLSRIQERSHRLGYCFYFGSIGRTFDIELEDYFKKNDIKIEKLSKGIYAKIL